MVVLVGQHHEGQFFTLKNGLLFVTQLLLNAFRVQLQRANEIHTDQSKGKLFDETNVRLETLEEANLQMQMLVESLQQENKTLVQTTGQQV